MKVGFETGTAPEPGEPTGGPVFSPPAAAELARLFPQLEIVALLGHGGMGAVYKARQPALDRWVALKVLPPQATGKPGFADRFNREARALARLNHPGIVAVHDFGQAGGMPYFVMEYVDGLTLRQLGRERPLTPREALQIVPQICEALQYAHDEGVVHRDIKPDNILIDKKGRVKIADFGIAKILGREGERTNLTSSQQVVGTPHYMAPEQIEHPQAVDHRADIYSLGVVFYEMLTGELPLGKFAPPSQKAQVDVRLDQVVLHALEKEPRRRYQQVREVKTDVDTIVIDNPGAATLLKSREAPSSSTRRRWLQASAVAAFMLLALLVVWFLKKPDLQRPLPRTAATSDNIVFPADAGVVDVTQPPYNAKPDGTTDATAAIQQALTDFRAKHAIVYLPDGIYLVSDTLRWGQGKSSGSLCKFTTLQGQSRDGTILRLKDACPGFNDPRAPQAVIWTGPNGGERYRNSLRNLTVDTGRNNPGAIGVQFNANNIGCLRDVLIRSGDGQGVTGLDMAFVDGIGPLLVKNLTVWGFNVGISTKDGLLSQTFEHIILENQNQVAFLNDSQTVSIRDLTTTGRVPALRNEGQVGLVVLVDARLSGHDEAKAHAAIINLPGLFVRNVTANGFAQAIVHNGPGATNVPGPLVREWSSRRFADSRASLSLPVKETPEVPWDPPGEWANAATFGATPDSSGDAGDAIQRAIDSGKRTVYLPRGTYRIDRPIQLRAKVRRFIGCEAALHISGADAASPVFTLAAGEAPVVVLERLSVNFPESASAPRFIDNPSPRTLVLRDCGGVGSEFTGPGEIFLENVAGRMIFHGQKVWARQFNQLSTHNMAREDWWHLRNDAGRLWVLGEMTSGPGPIVITTRGGQTEVLGGLMYSSGAALEQPDPAFVVEEGALSVSMSETSHRPFSYPVLVRRLTQGQRTDLLTPDQAPGGVNGSAIPLFATP